MNEEDVQGAPEYQTDSEQLDPVDEQSATLILKRSGALTQDSFPVRPPAIIGRFDPDVGPIDVDLGSLPEGVYVSRRHAKISREDGAWTIEDLGSSNGTFILRGDFERIEKAELSDGDEIALGNARFEFRTGPAQAEAPEQANQDMEALAEPAPQGDPLE